MVLIERRLGKRCMLRKILSFWILKIDKKGNVFELIGEIMHLSAIRRCTTRRGAPYSGK